MKRVLLLAGMGLMALTSFAQVPTAGLQVHYPFNGDANDASVNNNHGTASGLSYVTDEYGNPNGAAEFQNNAYVAMPEGLSIFQQQSISVRFKTTSTGVICGTHDQAYPNTPNNHVPVLTIRTNGTLAAQLWSGSVNPIVTSSAVNDGQWHHVALVGDATSQQLYLDNIYVGTMAGIDVLPTMTHNHVGSAYASGSWNTGFTGWNMFSGSIDDFIIYNRKITTGEIDQLFVNAPPKTIYVDIDATGDNDGTEWSNAYTELETALDNAVDGDEIWVAEGTYVHSSTNRSLRTFTVNNNIKLLGGFDGTETSSDNRAWRTHQTILSGDYNGDDDANIDFSNALRADNAYTILLLNADDMEVDGFYIQDGNANSTSPGHKRYGAGLYVEDHSLSLKVSNCVIRDNSAYGDVAMYAFAKTATTVMQVNIANCEVSNNFGQWNPSMCYAASGGGFVIASQVNTLIANNVIKTTSASAGAGGSIRTAYGTGYVNVMIANCTYVGNQESPVGNNVGTLFVAEHVTSGPDVGSVAVHLYNNIFYGNSTTDIISRGTYTYFADEVHLRDNITEMATTYAASVDFSNTGEQLVDPTFVDPNNGDYMLQTGSPAINAGDTTLLSYVMPATDLNARTRILGSDIDLGAYEHCTTPIANISATTSEVCENETLDLSPGTSQPDLLYSWTYDNTTFSNDSAASNNITTAGNYVISLTAGSPGCMATDVFAITVNESPILSAPSTIEVCDGETVTLTATGADTYVWSPTATNGVGFTPAFVGLTVFNVTGTSTSGCSTTETVSVTNNELPAVTAHASDNPICDGASIILNATGPATAYTWDNGAIDNEIITPSATTTYNVTGTDDNGCSNTADIVVTVTNDAAPIVTASASSTSLCEGDNLTLTANGAVTYQWSHGLNTVGITPVVGDITYFVEGVDGNGCSSMTSVSITVSELPVVTITASNTEICDGTSITLSSLGADNYTWDGGVSNGVAFAPLQSGIFSVTGTTNGCSAVESVNITVHDTPALTITASEYEVCAETSIQLSVLGASTYSWSNGGSDGATVVMSESTIFNVTGTSAAGCTSTGFMNITVNDLPVVSATMGQFPIICEGASLDWIGTGADSYVWSNGLNDGANWNGYSAGMHYVTITGTSAEGCSASQPIAIEVMAGIDTPVITQNGDELSITVTGGYIQWYVDGGLISGANGQSINTTDPGDYHVVVMNLTGCDATSDTYTIEPTGLSFAAQNDIRVYPQPVHQFVSLEGSNIEQIKVVNALGAVIYESATNFTNIDVSNWQNGIYLLQVDTPKGTSQHKIIKN